MGQITSLFVHKVIAQAHDSLDKRAFLEAVGVDPDAPVDPKVMVADTDYYEFFAGLARADPNGLELPLRSGATMRCENYGAFGLAWKSAPNLRGSCERASRYARVLTSVSTYEVREADEGVYMHLHREGDRAPLGLRLSNEATIASIAAISQEVSTSTFQALAIYFKHPVPGSAAAHERHFGCPVHFGADMDALLVSHDTMQAPNRVGDPSIVKFFDTHLEEQLSKRCSPRAARAHTDLPHAEPGHTDRLANRETFRHERPHAAASIVRSRVFVSKARRRGAPGAR